MTSDHEPVVTDASASPVSKPPSWDVLGVTTRRDLLPLLAISMVVGLTAGWFLFPEGWTSANRLGAGFMLGLGSWLILYSNRMVGGADVY